MVRQGKRISSNWWKSNVRKG